MLSPRLQYFKQGMRNYLSHKNNVEHREFAQCCLKIVEGTEFLNQVDGFSNAELVKNSTFRVKFKRKYRLCEVLTKRELMNLWVEQHQHVPLDIQIDMLLDIICDDDKVIMEYNHLGGDYYYKLHDTYKVRQNGTN